jgi:hypothetical protein
MPERCKPPGDADKARLISFVRLKYNVPSTAEIGVADGGIVLNSCFRKLVFASLGGREFRAELFVSPDFRFLTGELLDARPDSKQAAARRRQTAADLVRGSLPARGSEKASATLAVFSDFQCPYCARMASTLSGLAASESDRLRIVYHYFSLHPQMGSACRDGRGLRAAAEQRGVLEPARFPVRSSEGVVAG